MRLIPIPTPIIRENDDLCRILLKKFKRKLKNEDVIAISSKVIAISENAVVNYMETKTTREAYDYAQTTNLPKEFCQLVIDEADEILGAVPGAILTIRNNICIANAGIDRSNIEHGKAVLWPENAEKFAKKLRLHLKKSLKLKHLGILIVDSHCMPLRSGTSGLAIAVSGFEAVHDERGKSDLFGNRLRITQRNIADMLASAADFHMGDTNEQIPVVIIRGAEVRFTEKKQGGRMIIDRQEDLFAGLYDF